jgi:predicted nucleic acid-binding protein
MKVLVDTNVVLDFFLAREPWAKDADKVFKLISEGKVEAFITANSITGDWIL